MKESLPAAPLQNIYNNVGVKVRLTFKVQKDDFNVTLSDVYARVVDFFCKLDSKDSLFFHTSSYLRAHKRKRRISYCGKQFVLSIDYIYIESSVGLFTNQQVLFIFCTLPIHEGNSDCHNVRFYRRLLKF